MVLMGHLELLDHLDLTELLELMEHLEVTDLLDLVVVVVVMGHLDNLDHLEVMVLLQCRGLPRHLLMLSNKQAQDNRQIHKKGEVDEDGGVKVGVDIQYIHR